ncbi:hypothetical protein B0H16DRAFT_1792223 [Mycena metata]|uniref:Uncharacterized protein n=1 Tax=Mycena metata TaxID=1033252 RepID=A0AAD7HIR4_9AGAR|nr:hypothetical protein B0H16DRAFT_1792223 [Mycena metata]
MPLSTKSERRRGDGFAERPPYEVKLHRKLQHAEGLQRFGGRRGAACSANPQASLRDERAPLRGCRRNRRLRTITGKTPGADAADGSVGEGRGGERKANERSRASMCGRRYDRDRHAPWLVRPMLPSRCCRCLGCSKRGGAEDRPAQARSIVDVSPGSLMSDGASSPPPPQPSTTSLELALKISSAPHQSSSGNSFRCGRVSASFILFFSSYGNAEAACLCSGEEPGFHGPPVFNFLHLLLERRRLAAIFRANQECWGYDVTLLLGYHCPPLCSLRASPLLRLPLIPIPSLFHCLVFCSRFLSFRPPLIRLFR